jgi:hypothetical protein
LEEKRKFALVERPEINGTFREFAQRREFGLGEPSGRAQRKDVDQVGIAREGAETLVRGIAEPGWTEGTHLPVAEPRRLEEAEQRRNWFA